MVCLRLVLELDGRSWSRLPIRISGCLHRGTEKLMEAGPNLQNLPSISTVPWTMSRR